MAKFYIQLENQRLPIGEITREEVLAALEIDELFNFTGNFYDLDNNPFSNEANGEFNIVDEEGRIIAIVDKDGIHSIEMTAEDESGTVHKLTDKMNRSDFDDIISVDSNDFIIQDSNNNYGFVLNGEGAKAYDFITSENDSLLNVAYRVKSIESNVGSLNDIISDSNDSEFIIIGEDDKVGLKLNSEGLHVQDVTAYGNGQHVLSEKANMQYVETVKSELENKIEDEINKLDNTVTTSGSTHGVKVTVTQTNGNISSVSVDDSKIDFTKLTSNPIDVNEESQSFVIEDGRGNKGFVLNGDGAKAYDFITSTGVSLNGLNTTVVGIRTEVDNINNMISAEEEGSLIIRDDSGDVGLKLDKDGLFVQDVTVVKDERTHILSDKADQSDVDTLGDNINERIDNLTTTVTENEKDIESKFTTLSNVVSSNKEEIDNTIASLTTTVSGSGSTHGVSVKVEQSEGLITKVSVNDSTIDFYKLASNPIENLEDDKFVIKDESDRYGLKLDSEGLHVQDVFAYVSGGYHVLSDKANQSDVEDIDERLEVVEKFFDEGNEEFIDNLNDVIDFFKDVKETDTGVALLTTVATHDRNIGENASNITTLSTIVSSNKEEIDASITTLSTLISSNASNINKNASDIEDVNNRINDLTTETAVSDAGGTHGVIVEVSQYQGLIHSVVVKDDSINFTKLNDNPIDVYGEAGAFVIAGNENQYGLKLDSEGLHVQDVYTGDRVHQLSLKADKEYVDFFVDDVNDKIDALTSTRSGSGSKHGISVTVSQENGLITKVSVNDSNIDFTQLAKNPITVSSDKLEISLNDTVLTTISSDGISTEKKMRAKEGFYQTSDETLKVFHDDIEVNFNTLNSIPKMYYTWKGDNVKQIGTSAQKVQEIYPELVSLNEQTGKLSLDYAKLSIIALKAIDLLHEENESLKLEIETLHNEMDKIKSHLGL